MGRLSQALEYEALHTVSFSCGIVGHRIDKCPTAKAALAQQSAIGEGEMLNGEVPVMEVQNNNVNYGPWMLVTRKFRKGSGSRGKQQSTGAITDPANRFTALDSCENMDEESQSNQKVVEAWERGVRSDGERLSFKELKAKVRKEKSVVNGDSQEIVKETQFSGASDVEKNASSQAAKNLYPCKPSFYLPGTFWISCHCGH